MSKPTSIDSINIGAPCSSDGDPIYHPVHGYIQCIDHVWNYMPM